MNILGTFINNGEIRDIHDVIEPNITTESVTSLQETKKSVIHLNKAIGKKIDFIRVMNSLYELGFFQNIHGGKITKKEFFTTIGNAVNVNLSNYDKDLSRSTADSTALDKHLHVFDEMREKMIEIFNSK